MLMSLKAPLRPPDSISLMRSRALNVVSSPSASPMA